jgi:plastocyanin
MPAPSALRLSGFAFLLSLGTACSSSDSNNESTAPDFSVAVGAAAATTLGSETTFDVTLTSSNFAGPVTLVVSGAPASWTVTIPGNPVTLTSNGNAIVTITVSIPTDGDPATAGQALTVDATGTPGTHSGNTSVTVANEVIVPIASGTDVGPHWGALAGTTLSIKVGTTITVRNDDATLHRVHYDAGVSGLAHQQNDMGIGESYSQTATGMGTTKLSCHIHGHDTAGFINVAVQ